MPANQINQGFIKGIQVLAEAEKNNSRITVSRENGIHIQTIFEKIFCGGREKKSPIQQGHHTAISNNKDRARNYVRLALEAEIKSAICLRQNSAFKFDDALNHEIENISDKIVKSMLKEQSIQSDSDLNQQFGKLITDKTYQKNLHLTDKNKNLILNALANVKELNQFSLSAPDKFNFVKSQLNQRLNALEQQNNLQAIDPGSDKKTPIKSADQVKDEINHINDIADRAAWVKNHTWLDNRRALGWAVGMSRTELHGLSNKDRYDINWKIVKSAGVNAKPGSILNWQADFKELASQKTSVKQKHIEKYLQSLPHENLGGRKIRELARELLSPRYEGLNPAGRFRAYMAVNTETYFGNQNNQSYTTTSQAIDTAIDAIRNDAAYRET